MLPLPLLFSGLCAAAATAPPPHVLLIVSDDHGFGNVGYHNSTMLTPRIDEIAQAGVILEGYYVQPVCSPTRSSLMVRCHGSEAWAGHRPTPPCTRGGSTSTLLCLVSPGRGWR
jgi:hypothetical protein